MTGARVVAALVASLLVFGTAFAARIPVTFTGQEATLRLSWRVDGVVIEECRTRTEAELEAMPVHMRNPEACIGELAPFSLSVSVDGGTVLSETLVPGGARGDRPVFVFDEIRVPPGSRRLSVDFRAVTPDGASDTEAVRAYEWEGELDLEQGEVALVTIDESGVMEVRRSSR